MVRELGKEEAIDRSYYDNMVDEAAKAISQYGDLEWFVSDNPYVGTPPWDASEQKLPPWFDAGEPYKEDESTPFDVR